MNENHIRIYKYFEVEVSESIRLKLDLFAQKTYHISKVEFKESLKKDIYRIFKEFTKDLGLGNGWDMSEENVKLVEENIDNLSITDECVEHDNIYEMLNHIKKFNFVIDNICGEIYNREHYSHFRPVITFAKFIAAATIGLLSSIVSACGISLIFSTLIAEKSLFLLPLTIPLFSCIGISITMSAVANSSSVADSKDQIFQKQLDKYMIKINKVLSEMEPFIEYYKPVMSNQQVESNFVTMLQNEPDQKIMAK